MREGASAYIEYSCRKCDSGGPLTEPDVPRSFGLAIAAGTAESSRIGL